MPPKVKVAESGLRDIRSFFGRGNATSQISSPGPSSQSSKPPTQCLSHAIYPISNAENKASSANAGISNSSSSGSSRKRNHPVLISDASDAEQEKKKTIQRPKPVTPANSPSKPTSVTEETPPPVAQPAKKRPRVILSDSDDDGPPQRKPASPQKKASPSKSKANPSRKSTGGKRAHQGDGSEADAQFTEEDKPKPQKKRRASTGSKKARKSVVNEEEDVKTTEEEVIKPPRKARKPNLKGETTSEPIPVEAPKKDPQKKWIPPAAKGPPPAQGSKLVPDGDPNALAGLTFVFTGELSAFSRDEIVDLAKRYGGYAIGRPNWASSYVTVSGDEGAGPKKLADIQRLGIKTLDEDGFLDLIGTRKGELDTKAKEKLKKEEEKMKKDVANMEKREKEMQGKGADSSAQLWTTKYAPQTLKEICGNKGQVEKLQAWLREWEKNLKSEFKKGGPNGTGLYRAVLITGPPGTGKTTSAHLVSKLEGFQPIELNASDARSKRLVENSTNIMNTSLDGWMGSQSRSTNVAGVEISDKSVLIMDEVDGMSAGDRGGVGALNALIKKTKIPIICIANDRRAPKLKPLTNTCFSLPFKKPEANAMRSRLLTIAMREKLKISANVVDQLVQGANSDMRQVLNMLSTWKLSSDSMDFEEGKQLAAANEKHVIMTPYSVTEKILGPYVFSRTSRETLNDKIEYYFHDHSFVPLFIQENYLKPTPARLRGSMEGPEMDMKRLELMDKASSAISDGDLVGAMVMRGQHWGLLPLHAIHSTVRPSFHIYGMGAGYAGSNAVTFPSWLGQNSKQGKLQRQLNDVQTRMRLKVSGDRHEIRQSYIPSLYPHIVQPLMMKGNVDVDEVIESMDQYYISKEDWDTIVELGVGDYAQDVVMKKIPSAVKSALTRKYNSSEHPVPFHKATELGSRLAKKIAKGEVPDQEDVIEFDEAEDEVDEASAEEDNDLSRDKFIKGKGSSMIQAKSKSKANRK
ncbi:replication factor RFC1 C terminal domain-containing protein [Cantharellus anzutake]|uniref:replication factor RFC1 C terminal domain-containing protein n=1 Tax=Cantharellus anzutake TaxID=1750568 RepID=UPI001905EB0F|nr:replication factor RFC1 C terminal domain-containing protein [Cantharellus anzutake]KAF8341289.1 replication factor RFC1 C terminal domain-containing protein [Cantharellus anzutake]